MLLQARQSPSIPGAISRIPLYLSLIAVEFGFVWFVAIGIHQRGRNLVDLVGHRWRTASDGLIDSFIAIVTVAMLRLVVRLFYFLFGRWPSHVGFLLPQTGGESVAWIVVSITAGICEELVYRGYLQRQLWSLTKSLSIAILLQTIVFACSHIYQGWRSAAVTAIFGLVFGLLAAWRRSIIPGAIAHSLIDVMGALLRR